MFAWQCDDCEANAGDHDPALLASYATAHRRLLHAPDTAESAE